MLASTKIRVTSPWLGSERTAQQVRRFERDNFSKQLKLDLAQWNWALDQALESLDMKHIDPGSVRFPVHIDAPSLELFLRRWSNTERGQQQEKFESIRAGTQLTFNVLLTTAREPSSGSKVDTRPPTVEEFKKIMSFIGEHVGLSPWGNRMGYGRFQVMEVTRS